MLDGLTTDRQRWNLRGPVRTCTLHRTWSACGGDGQCGTDARHDAAYLEFRPDGALTLHRHENHDGSGWESVREYDEAGRLVSMRTGLDGTADESMYEYDAGGRLERVVGRRAGSPDRVLETYEYAADGTMTKIEYVESPEAGCCGGSCMVEGTGATTIVVQHNRRGQPLQTTFNDSEGRPLTKITLSYDQDGRLVEEVHTVMDVALPEEVRAKCSPEDLEQLRAMLGGGRVHTRQVHRYDARGLRIETRSALFGALGEHRQIFAYNEHGDPVEEVDESSHQAGSIDQDGQVIPAPESVTKSRSEARYSYEYDAQANWVKKVVEGRANGGGDFSVSTIETRQVEYYPSA